jgi:glutathionylspermidine synthase
LELNQPTATFVDLPPTSVLPATVWLNQHGFIVVPIIQRWVAFPSVLDCSRLLDQLITFSERCRRPASPRGVVFVLDGERAGTGRASSAPSKFDNRYGYSGGLFPRPDDLWRRGVSEVRWVGVTDLAPDLRPYALSLADAGQCVVVGRMAKSAAAIGVFSRDHRSSAVDVADMARYRRFVRRGYTRGLLADNLVVGEPYLALDPVILSAKDDNLLRQLTRTFASAFDRAARRIAAEVGSLEDMGFPWVAAELLQAETPRAPVVGRFDFARDDGGNWWLLEFNADTPSGVREATGGEEALLDVIPALRRYDRPNAGLRGSLGRAFVAALRRIPAGATLGLVASAGELEDIAQVAFIRHLLVGALASRSVRVVLGDVDNLRARRAGLYLGRERIDALYRCFSFESTFGTPAFAAIYDAVAAGRVILLNGLFGLLLQHKGVMAWLWAHQDDPALSDEERQAIRRHLPPTWSIADWGSAPDIPRWDDGKSVVVKQVFGREGEEVFFGNDLTSEQWDALHRQRTYVVQLRISIAPHWATVPTQHGSSLRKGYPTVGSFVVDGEWGGYYSRLGDKIITARAQWLATLAESGRAP